MGADGVLRVAGRGPPGLEDTEPGQRRGAHQRRPGAQSDLICAPQPLIAEESPAVQIGGYFLVTGMTTDYVA